ncbi:hypothetical protein GCM10014715_89550 [Streptomyces spiralis]|uniref:Secreted protein n=1 Tax=Streptomyces spiralis TaxID=66376 RepID=A0A919AQD7_9ACTN|nr:hypothetical protein [Streptomyces spiralis]GHF21558.1 hypothetical protein GCM10014715_89550 [Streptomyces spiralis]
MRKVNLRGAGLAAAVSSCLMVGVWAAPVSAVSGSPENTQSMQSTPVKSPLRCYATRSDPKAVVCYRFSEKAEFRHGEIVYVPILIQVPTPSNPPAITVVDSLSDVRPTDTGPGTSGSDTGSAPNDGGG